MQISVGSSLFDLRPVAQSSGTSLEGWWSSRLVTLHKLMWVTLHNWSWSCQPMLCIHSSASSGVQSWIFTYPPDLSFKCTMPSMAKYEHHFLLREGRSTWQKEIILSLKRRQSTSCSQWLSFHGEGSAKPSVQNPSKAISSDANISHDKSKGPAKRDLNSEHNPNQWSHQWLYWLKLSFNTLIFWFFL